MADSPAAVEDGMSVASAGEIQPEPAHQATRRSLNDELVAAGTSEGIVRTSGHPCKAPPLQEGEAQEATEHANMGDELEAVYRAVEAATRRVKARAELEGAKKPGEHY